VIRLFNVYYPIRTLVLLVVEALIVGLSFVLGTLWNLGWLQFNNELFIEGGYLRIFTLTGVVLLLSHGFDLYDTSQLSAKLDQAFRLLFVLGLVALGLEGVDHFVPGFLPGRWSSLLGIGILTFALFCWRSAYSWVVRKPFFRERVYVLGTGDRAERLVRGWESKLWDGPATFLGNLQESPSANIWSVWQRKTECTESLSRCQTGGARFRSTSC
jgi:hypothetical protein